MTKFTRNLYNQDEVEASLLYCMMRGLTGEALFWAEEIRTSNGMADLIQQLMQFYILFVQPWQFTNGIFLIKEGEVKDKLLILTIAIFIQTHKDSKEKHRFSPALDLLFRHSYDDNLDQKGLAIPAAAPDWIWSEGQVRGILPNAASTLSLCMEISLKMSDRYGLWKTASVLHQHDAAAFWMWIRAHTAGNDKAELDQQIGFLQRFENSNTTICHFSIQLRRICAAEAVILLCASKKERKERKKPLNPTVDTDVFLGIMEDWHSICGTRAARLVPIRLSALYGVTERGRTENIYSNIEDLYRLVDLPASCTWWKQLCKEKDITSGDEKLIFPNDTTKELFFDTWFPDDIPDEWSLEDQTKSHGLGVLKKDEEITLKSILQRFVPNYIDSDVEIMDYIDMVGESLPHDIDLNGYVDDPLDAIAEIVITSYHITPDIADLSSTMNTLKI